MTLVTKQRIIGTAADLPIRAAVGSEYLMMTAYEDTR
jgi:hypothetical protein